MGTNNDNFDQLNQEIDELIDSGTGLGAALDSNNTLLYLAARLISDPKPILTDTAKAKILATVSSAQIIHSNANIFAKLGQRGLATLAIVTVIALASLFAILPNNNAENNTTLNLNDSGNQSESNDTSSAAELVITEESPSNAVEATQESIIIETSLPELIQETMSSEEPKPTETVNSTSNQAESSNLLYVLPGGPINVRSGPATSFAIIAQLTPNTELIRIGTNAAGDWIEVIMPDGKQGWIASFLVTKQKGADGQIESSGGDGRDATQDCEHGKSCNAAGQTGENQGNGNASGRGQGNSG